MRAYLERNSIGLLTAQTPPVDAPSAQWLGNHSPETVIRRSGLWNLNHVGRPYDPAFLDKLEEYVSGALAEPSLPMDETCSTHTDHLRAFIGGYMGSSYGVQSDNGGLVYERFESGYTLAETVAIHPSPDDWDDFWKRLESLGVWSWEKEYVQHDVCDGTNWSLELKRRGASFSAAGSNAFPEHFDSFCNAVANLAGGRSFE